MLAMSALRTIPDSVCLNCGLIFRPTSGSKGKYCKRECWYEDYKKQHLANCPVCGKEFSTSTKRKTCSMECGNESKRSARNTRCALEGCMNLLAPTIQPRVRFCSKSHALIGNRHGKPHRAPGDRQPHSGGYWTVKTELGWRLEHRVVMEQTLGRPLEKHERVHHKNGQRGDNRPENLELWKVKGKKDPAGVRASDYHCPGCRCGEVPDGHGNE